jgi:hypothetical protein
MQHPLRMAGLSTAVTARCRGYWIEYQETTNSHSKTFQQKHSLLCEHLLLLY